MVTKITLQVVDFPVFSCLNLYFFSTYHACSGKDLKLFYWTNGMSHLLIFHCHGEPPILTKKIDH